MIWVDWIIIAILFVSAVFGLMRGMVRELIALGTWIAAIMIARLFAPQVSEMLTPYIESNTVRTGLAFALTALVVVMLGSVISKLAGRLVSVTGLGGFDRVLGFIFGGARGVAILVVLTAIISLTSLQESDWWSASRFVPLLEDLRDQAMGLINEQIS